MLDFTRSLVVLTLILGLGCDAEEALDSPELSELSELEASDAPLELAQPEAPRSLDEHEWTEASAADHPTELTPPPSKGACTAGYWQTAPKVDLQGCGTCMLTIPHPDRPGNLGLWWVRWCWTSPGCTGMCEPWFVDATSCYDWCG